MRPNRTWSILLLALSTATPALAQCMSPQPDHATLTVKGAAMVERAPELAKVGITLLTRGPTLDGTSRAHMARVAQAAATLDRLRSGGVTVDQGTFGLTEERAEMAPGARPGNEPPTYRAGTRYDLTIPALDKVDAVVADVVGTGLFELSSARYALADDRVALNDARRAAMADARQQADVYAEAGGLRIEGIDSIADGEAAPRGDGAFDMPERMAGIPSLGISPPKTLAFQGGVTVTWRVAAR